MKGSKSKQKLATINQDECINQVLLVQPNPKMSIKQLNQFKKADLEARNELGLILQTFYTQRDLIVKNHNDQLQTLHSQAELVYLERVQKTQTALDKFNQKITKLKLS